MVTQYVYWTKGKNECVFEEESSPPKISCCVLT